MSATIVLAGPDLQWDGARLQEAVAALAAKLRGRGTRVLATLMDNAPAWVVADLAALEAGVVHVPLPGFFTADQIRHALQAAGVDTLLAPAAVAVLWPQGQRQALDVAGLSCAFVALPHAAPPLPAGTCKITFTSGSTGSPKGVCLREAGLRGAALGVVQALRPLGIDRHLCALPLAVLLENVAGMLAPLANGSTVTVAPLAELGLAGSSSFAPDVFDAAVARHAPHSLILLPQMLRAWTAWLQANGRRASASLKFVAVGGAAVGERLLAAARACGIPAYEGYGLSEGGSVQALNLPGADRPGSAGRPLPHARVRIAADGEIEIAGTLMAGYLGDARPVPEWLPTGDLGRLDADGFLHVEGRRKNLLITGFGRNVAPEWVEAALRGEGAIGNAVVFGEAQPALSAVLWPLAPATSDVEIAAAVRAANATLPDYARIARWVRGRAAFSADTGLATPNGRPRRDAILALHAEALGLPAASLPPEDRMPFFPELQQQTEAARQGLLAAPIIQGCLRGEVSLASYVAFLTEAYHHVKHTVPLLRACREALPPRHAWLREALDEYVEEEQGHDEWILDDLRACGADAEAVRHGRPGHAAEVMVAYAYDTIARGNPLGFLGMVHVLEGTSVGLALLAADRIQQPLGLPDAAFGYLRSHGTLDREHTAHFALLMDRIEDPADRAAIVHATRAFYRLYGDVFRGLPLPRPQPQAVPAEAA